MPLSPSFYLECKYDTWSCSRHLAKKRQQAWKWKTTHLDDREKGKKDLGHWWHCWVFKSAMRPLVKDIIKLPYLSHWYLHRNEILIVLLYFIKHIMQFIVTILFFIVLLSRKISHIIKCSALVIFILYFWKNAFLFKKT